MTIRLCHMRFRQAALVALAAVISAGCGSSRPVKYHSLDSGTQSSQPATMQFPLTILVARVTASHMYRDDRLVYGTSPLDLGTYEYERWAEPPVDMIQNEIIATLRATRQYRSVSPIASNLRGDYILRAHLDALEEIDKPEIMARFSIQWELYDPKSGTAVWSEAYTHDESVNGKKIPNVVEALDRNVKTGMNQLAVNLAQYFASHPPK